MIALTNLALDKRHRYPAEIIAPAVSLYFRCTRRYRAVEKLLADRGIAVRDETTRPWGRKFGQLQANQSRRRRAPTGDKGYLDEGFLKINGQQYYRWRAVDQYGEVLDVRLTSKRDKHAAQWFFPTARNERI